MVKEINKYKAWLRAVSTLGRARVFKDKKREAKRKGKRFKAFKYVWRENDG